MGAGKKPFTSQVAGHAGVSMSEDGSLLFKPALPHEVAFYEHLTSDPGSAPLRRYIPKFYGTLRLEGQVEDGNLETLHEAPAPSEEKESIVLENLTHRFLKPNILDLKLGTRLHDDEASEEKKARMIEKANDTTSSKTGLLLTGFQIHDTVTGQAVTVPRSYGKSLKPSDLPDGIAKFFPVHSEQLSQGLPKEQLLPVIESIRRHVAAVRDAFARLELRMIGGSFLIVYEGDLERAKQGIALLGEGDSDEDEEDDEDESDDEDEDEEKIKPCPPCLVKLIDFAHTKVVTGRGPDEGVLLGMDTTLKLLDGRIAQIKQS
ncbi:hypothetical protein BJ322DRAFT_1034064 [Thelephora terrestris]|uniref:Kinase n=1 Tax=Thelephora terrestris TaxID=56493 RepID=A0A9P6HRC4_9AGAM|nr:hypothetical protein BJ322DRAFT_1034064 [Thelephora terrestris]